MSSNNDDGMKFKQLEFYRHSVLEAMGLGVSANCDLRGRLRSLVCYGVFDWGTSVVSGSVPCLMCSHLRGSLL